MPAQSSTQRSVVLATFGFSEMSLTDSAQCQPAQSQTPRSVIQFWIYKKYSKLFRKINIQYGPQIPCRWRCSKTQNICWTSRSVSLLRVRLRAALANFGYSKILFPTLRSISLRRVTSFANISVKMKILVLFLLAYQEPRWVRFRKKML